MRLVVGTFPNVIMSVVSYKNQPRLQNYYYLQICYLTALQESDQKTVYTKLILKLGNINH